MNTLSVIMIGFSSLNYSFVLALLLDIITRTESMTPITPFEYVIGIIGFVFFGSLFAVFARYFFDIEPTHTPRSSTIPGGKQ